MSLILRLADENDCKQMYIWRNDPEARKNSRNKSKVPYEEHEVWFRTSLENPDRRIYIGMDCGKRIGQVRFDRENSTIAEVSVIIDSQKTGKGYGTLLIKEGSTKYFKESDIETIRAEVFKSNPASLRAFKKAGYEFFREFNYDGEVMIEFQLTKKKNE